MMTLTSCSETNDEIEEFPEWQQKNDAYFEALFNEAKHKQASGDKTWQIIPCWSMPEGHDFYSPLYYECIVVEVLEEGKGVNSPIYTDVTRVHYQGRLIPSTSYSQGMVFDQSFPGEFNPATAVPATLEVHDVVDGFATALQNMHPGDHWRVYIPYQLGYGKSKSGDIPGYSTLIFDIRFVDFHRHDAE